ncbi:MAG: hypothetical protein ACYTF1_12270 [Planctomycetota bacterium]
MKSEYLGWPIRRGGWGSDFFCRDGTPRTDLETYVRNEAIVCFNIQIPMGDVAKYRLRRIAGDRDLNPNGMKA